MLGRVVFGGLAVLIAIRLLHVSLRVSLRQLVPLTAQGLVLALHWSTFFQAINVGGVAIGLLSFSTFPLFTAALEPIVLRTRPTRLQIFASIVILFGVYVLVPSFSLHNAALQAVLWGLVSAATFALLSVFNRKLGESHISTVISFYQFVTAAVVLSPVLVWDHPSHLTQIHTVFLLLFLGTVCTALAHTMFISGLRHISTMLASLFASLEPVWGIVFAVILLSEVPTLRSFFGGLLIIGASAMAAGCRSPSSKAPVDLPPSSSPLRQRRALRS